MGLVDRSEHSYFTIHELLEDGYGKVILIEGDPGAGKTTFSFQVCKQWAENKLLTHDVVFWIPLCHYKSVTTINELFDKLGCPEMLSYAQQNNGKCLVLILDGWDELPNHLQAASLFHDIIFGTIGPFTCSTIIVTSRPSCSAEIAEAVEETKSYYQILGFDQEKAVTYIETYFCNDPSSAKLLRAFLNSNKYLCQHFYIPISVAIVCFVFRSDNCQIPQSLSKLYEQFVVLCLRSNVPDLCHPELAKFKTIRNIPEKIISPFHKLCKTAFSMLKDTKMILKEEELEITQDNLQFDGFGLLHVDHYTSVMATVETSYSFIHRAVQELLAAIFIVKTGNINDVFDKYFYVGSYLLNVFPFVFSLMPEEIHRPVAKKLIQIFNEQDRSTQLLSSILFSLFEAHDDKLCIEFSQAFSENKKIVLIFGTLLDCHYACYFIRVCCAKELNVMMFCDTEAAPSDLFCEIIADYLQSTSTGIASFHFRCGVFRDTLSCKGMKQIAKALSVQSNILSVELSADCEPGSTAILCDAISQDNTQITNLNLSDSDFNIDDLESVGSVLTSCLFLKSLKLYCSPSEEGRCLELSAPFCEPLKKARSLQNLRLFQWSMSQKDSEMFTSMISNNCSLKEVCINIATDCLDAILSGLSSNTSITTFILWPSNSIMSNTLGWTLEKCFTQNHSLNIIDFTNSVRLLSLPPFQLFVPVCILWSSAQVSSICAGLRANTTVVTIDISGCYIDTEACRSVCGMLSENKTLQHLFLNPVHFEKQQAIDMINSCNDNHSLELLSLVQWCVNFPMDVQDENPLSRDPDVLLMIQNIRQENDQLPLQIYWLVAT